MSNTNWLLVLSLSLFLTTPALCDEPNPSSKADEVARLKQRIAELEKELAKATRPRSGVFGHFELLPSVLAGNLPEAEATVLSKVKDPDITSAEGLAFKSLIPK